MGIRAWMSYARASIAGGSASGAVARAATVMELDHRPRPAGHVGHDESATRQQFIEMPFDLGDHASRMTLDQASMTRVGGGGFSAPEDGQVQIIALVGEANRDAAISSANAASVKQRLRQTVRATGPQQDINNDGSISSADVGAVKQRLGGTARACP